MGSNYTGNPSATQSPSPTPGPGVIPIVFLPGDGDQNNVATMFNQQYRCLTDFLAFLQTNAALGKGTFSILALVTDDVGGQVVVRPLSAAQIYALNSAGQVRAVLVDKNGLPGGGFCTNIVEDWIGGELINMTASGQLPPPFARWYATVPSGMGARIYTSPAAVPPFPGQTVTIRGGASTSSLTGLFLGGALTNAVNVGTSAASLSCVFECEVGIDASHSAGNYFTAGLAETTSLNSFLASFIWEGSGNWTCQNQLGARFDTGIPPTFAQGVPGDRLRIEMHNAASPLGECTLFFLNEIFMTSILGWTSSGSPGFTCITGATAFGFMNVGQVRLAYNRWPNRLAV